MSLCENCLTKEQEIFFSKRKKKDILIIASANFVLLMVEKLKQD